MAEELKLKATLKAHAGWVTAVAAPLQPVALDAPAPPKMFLSASRDKSVIVWRIEDKAEAYAVAERSLTAHSHFVQAVTLTMDSAYALTASWDGTLRLWDLATGKSRQTFIGHTKDVLTVAMNPLTFKILSGGRDKSIRLWNVIGECKATIDSPAAGAHTDWVSAIAFSPKMGEDVAVSASWDKVVKVWDCSGVGTPLLRYNLTGHTGYLNTVTVSPDGSLCASGGRDGSVHLFGLVEGRKLYELNGGSVIHSVVFSPTRYWLCAATDKNVTIWDLESKEVVATLEPEFPPRSDKALVPYCTSLCWNADGTTLFAGFTDNQVRVWTVEPAAAH
jgi:guanine nucleotide-binding protein subunit beta-2-like 1 protein